MLCKYLNALSFNLWNFCITEAMYKTKNPETGNGMLGTQGMGEMLYSGECRQTFWGIFPKIFGNVSKHSRECLCYSKIWGRTASLRFHLVVWGKEKGVMWFSVSGAPLDDWDNGGFVWCVFLRMVSMVLVPRAVDPILCHGYGIQW